MEATGTTPSQRGGAPQLHHHQDGQVIEANYEERGKMQLKTLPVGRSTGWRLQFFRLLYLSGRRKKAGRYAYEATSAH